MKKRPIVERDPNPFSKVSGPSREKVPAKDARYLELVDVALGNKEPEPSRKKKKFGSERMAP